MRTSVITIAAGRNEHLRWQRRGLSRSAVAPHHHVVVAMGSGDGLDPVLAESLLPTVTTRVEVTAEGLPLAAARNAGAEVAMAEGAELLVFLDVDCIPSPLLVGRYARAAAVQPTALLAGPVAYLPAPPPGGYDLDTPDTLDLLAVPHPARPVPADGTVVAETRTELFWSLSFAVTVPTWRRAGGFHPGYVGYGAEDTDFALVAAAAGVQLHWVGGATAFHQHHGPSGPTEANAPSIVRNAQLFHRRHGWWPMGGWLRQLADCGLVRFDPETDLLELSA